MRRSDGQTIRYPSSSTSCSRLSGPIDRPVRSASRVSAAYGRQLSQEGLVHLASSRLAPLGLLAPVGPADPESHPPAQSAPPRALPLLSLALRGVLVPTGLVRVIARILHPLFWTPVVLVVLVAAAVVDVIVVRSGDASIALQQVLATPALLLALWVVLTVGGLAHEMGHAVACRYGGAEPVRSGSASTSSSRPSTPTSPTPTGWGAPDGCAPISVASTSTP